MKFNKKAGNMQDSNGNFILCDELLIKILKYAGKYRNNAKLVCKKFLAIVCDIENDLYLYLSGDKLENDEAYATIMNSQRKFGRMILHTYENHSFEFYNRLKHVCMRHGANVKKLEWSAGHAYNQATYFEILSLMPNLEILACESWKLANDYLPEQPINSKLKNLKALSLSLCEPSITQLMNNLLEENSIKELGISTDVFPKHILLHQKSIVEISLDLDKFDAEDFHVAGLRELIWTYNSDDLKLENFEKLFTNQPNLTKLEFLGFTGEFENVPAFINICQLKLTELRMNVCRIDSNTFKKHFWRLTSLTKLGLELLDEHKIFFLNMRFLKMRSLKIHVYGELSSADLRKMGTNLPALEEIELHCCTVKIDDVLKYLRKLASISFFHGIEIWDGNRQYSNIKKAAVEKSDRLQTRVNLNEETLLKIMDSFPNLCTLKYSRYSIPLKIKLLDDILKSLPHLHTFKCLIFVQEGDDYEKFTEKSAFELKRFVKDIPFACVRVKLKETNMNEAKLKEILGSEFKVLTDNCNIIINTKEYHKCPHCAFY